MDYPWLDVMRVLLNVSLMRGIVILAVDVKIRVMI